MHLGLVRLYKGCSSIPSWVHDYPTPTIDPPTFEGALNQNTIISIPTSNFYPQTLTDSSISAAYLSYSVKSMQLRFKYSLSQCSHAARLGVPWPYPVTLVQPTARLVVCMSWSGGFPLGRDPLPCLCLHGYSGVLLAGSSLPWCQEPASFAFRNRQFAWSN